MRKYLINEGVPSEKIITIQNGFDAHTFHPGVEGGQFRRDRGIPMDAIVIAFVGSFQPYHKVNLLLEAFNRLYQNSNIHLLLVGDGQGLNDARELTAQLGFMDRVTFTGRVPYSDVPACLAAGDIAVMPATNTYGNPMKIYEYMALGKAVVAPDQPTITEIATQGENAILFEPENVTALSRALELLIVGDSLRKRIGNQGAKYAANQTWQNRARLLEKGINSTVFHQD
jgi:glycosyltransferase involved in cell wall biosynthesis